VAKITLGNVYAVAGFDGQPCGKGRKGGYLPGRGRLWKRYHEVNMPLLALAPAGRLLLRRDLEVERAYELCGLVWALISQAANTPRPGYFVEEFDGRLWPLGDARMAERMGLSLQRWQAAVAMLLGISGVGALELTTVEIEVADEAPYRTDGQLELPWEADRRSSAHSPRTSAPGPAHTNGTLRDGTPRNGTGRDAAEGRLPAFDDEERAATVERSQPPAEGRLRAVGDEGEPAVRGDDADRLPRLPDGLTLDRVERTLLAHVKAGQLERAHLFWIAGLNQLLCGGQATARDRRDFGRVFTAAWNRTVNRNVPSPRTCSPWAGS